MLTANKPLTLEQQRAADAWACAQKIRDEKYVNLAKGLPALIMNSGLLQVMAFLEEKGPKNPHCKKLGEHLRAWVHKRYDKKFRADFSGFMQDLMRADSRTFQAVTRESVAWLRWLRQLAPTVDRAER